MEHPGTKRLETERLLLREMTDADLPALCRMLQDEEVMYAYAHAFSDEEAHDWLSRQQARYRQYGFGLWAVILKSSGEMIGQCGVTVQDCNGREVLEVGYLFCKDFWGQGYATEAARAFAARLPLTLEMTELNGNEKYARLDELLPTASAVPDRIRTGDLMLWGDDTVVLFYDTFTTPYSYTRLGAVEEADTLARVLGRGGVRVTFAPAEK